MKKTNNWIKSLVLTLILPCVILAHTAYSNPAPITQAPGVQLAYFIGYHNYYGGTYVAPLPVLTKTVYYSRGAHWTRWRYVGYGCRRSCLIDNWSGRIITCQRACSM